MIYENIYDHLNKDLLETLTDKKEVFSFEYMCKFLNVAKTTSEITSSKVFVVNVLNFLGFVEKLSPTGFLDREIKNKINSGNAKLVINHCHERTHKYSNPFYRTIWNTLIEKIQTAGIDLRQVTFLSGDRYIEKSFAVESPLYKVIGLDTMEFVYNRWSQYHNVYSVPFSLDKDIDFLFLNAVPREHRCVIRYLLNEKDFLKNSINSWVIGDRRPVLEDIKTFIKHTQLTIDPQEIYNYSLVQKTLDSTSKNLRGQGNQNFMQLNWLKETKFSFVLETGYQENIMLVSEKTFKPMLFKHPFMVYSHPNHLTYLKECGYETYPELFDESYDLQDDSAKINTMLQNLESFKDRAEGKEKIINEKLEHNRQQFLSQPCLKTTKQSLISIFE